MSFLLVTPAQAGVPLSLLQRSGIPAFAGMTWMWALFLLLLPILPAQAQTFPQLTGRVVDQADLLRPEQEIDLTSKSEALEARTGRQFVVATVKSLEGRTIEDYGYRLGRHWKIGDEKRDDGVILLVAPKERKVRIETGYGARVFLTDAISSLIINQHILPRFKAGDMPGGIVAGADQIVRTMSLSPDQAAQRSAEAQAQQKRMESSRQEGGVPIFFIAIIFFFVVLPMLRGLGGGRGRRYHRRHRRGGIDPFVVLWGLNELSRGSRGGWGGGGWGGGGGGGWGGGGGFSGGGGSFGGGGASGGW